MLTPHAHLAVSNGCEPARPLLYRPQELNRLLTSRHKPCRAAIHFYQAWQLLAIFLSTITGLVLEPLPVGAWSFLGLTFAVRRRPAAASAPERAPRSLLLEPPPALL